LNVEEAAGDVVDGVLAVAAAEQRPADRHLGELDREDPRRVVDRKRDFRAAGAGLFRRAGEDDVLHLAAAQRLRALFTEDPRDRVYEVGFPGAVRADDDADAGSELEHGPLGERLETPDLKGFEKHAEP
jgi:hypothetical protein